MARPIMKRCIKCNNDYKYITEKQYLKNEDKYILSRIGFSLAHCCYCQQDLNKEKNYAMLMKRLGDSNSERRRNFKRIVSTSKKIMWMTYGETLPSDVCPHCGVRVEKQAFRGNFKGVAFNFCSPECKTEFDKMPYMDIVIKEGTEDFTCISENNSEYMYRQYDQLYRQQEKKIQESENETIKQANIESKKMYFKRMQLYKELWNKDKKYGSIDLMIKGL